MKHSIQHTRTYGVELWYLETQCTQNEGIELNLHKGTYIALSLYFGEGNGTPLHYSCLENPMDGRAW